MSDYFTPPTSVAPGELARSSDVNNISEAVNAAFNTLYPDLAGSESLKSTYVSLAVRLDQIEALAAGISNYAGIWEDLTGPLAIPASVFHDDRFWELLVTLPDVTLEEPSPTSTVWVDISPWATDFRNDINGNDYTLSNTVFKNSSETTQVLGTLTSNTDIDIDNGNVATLEIGADLIFTFSNPPVSGITGYIVLEMTNPGAFTITWPSAVKWNNELEPSWQETGVDYAVFVTTDAGTIWRGVRAYKGAL